MIPVAVVLIVLVIVFTIAIIIGNPQSFDLQVFVARIPANITGVYVTGAVTMLVLAVAGWLLWTGFHRQRAQQKEIRALKAAAGGRTKAVSAGGGKTHSDKAGSDKTSGTGKATTGEPGARGSAGSGDPEERAVKGPKGSAAASAADEKPGTETPAVAQRATDRKTDTAATPAREKPGSPAGRDDDRPSTTAEERRRLLDEADELTREDEGQ